MYGSCRAGWRWPKSTDRQSRAICPNRRPTTSLPNKRASSVARSAARRSSRKRHETSPASAWSRRACRTPLLDTRLLKNLLPEFRRGRGAGRVPWHGLVREWAHAGWATVPEVWAHARAVVAEAERDKKAREREGKIITTPDPIIIKVVESSADPACDDGSERAHPRGQHWHVRDRRGRVVPVAFSTLSSFMSSLRL